MTVPVIDISGLDGAARSSVAAAIDRACRDQGFFAVTGHGVDHALVRDLEDVTRAFFARPDSAKAEIAMTRGGRAWRGWFPLGGELTRGVPDGKEGIYFGAEHGDHHRRVRDGTALHGRNLFPAEPAAMKGVVLAWMDAMTTLAQRLMGAIGEGLGIGSDWFDRNLTSDPTTLFRIFTYPGDWPGDWGVAEHTDYGLLTVLLQDDCGGLQVRIDDDWHDVEPVPGAFVCNIGDMLERMTGGRYRSTPHRVANTSGRARVSFPFFFDPSWDAVVRPLPLADGVVDTVTDTRRWDGASVFDFDGTYGEYLTAKVARVFPALFAGISTTSGDTAGTARLTG